MIQPLREDPREHPEDRLEESPRPDVRKLRDLLQGPFGIRNVALTGLFVLAAFYTLYFTRSFLLPIVLALLFALLLTPLVRLLKRVHVPTAAAAGIVLAAVLGAVGLGIYELSGPA